MEKSQRPVQLFPAIETSEERLDLLTPLVMVVESLPIFCVVHKQASLAPPTFFFQDL